MGGGTRAGKKVPLAAKVMRQLCASPLSLIGPCAAILTKMVSKLALPRADVAMTATRANVRRLDANILEDVKMIV